jgi:exopolysaccharide biosynthesis predicted pyruvyltransferase EpsI
MAVTRARRILVLLVLQLCGAQEPDLHLDGSASTWLDCLSGIRLRLFAEMRRIFDARAMPATPIVLVDPAYHPNIGDNMMSVGEYALFAHLGWDINNVAVCAGPQTRGRGLACDFSNATGSAILRRSRLIAFHAGGNWGDLYADAHLPRLARIAQLLRGFSDKIVVSMPQSLHYHGVNSVADVHSPRGALLLAHARALGAAAREGAARGSRLVLMWRQADSHAIAQEAYPFATNLLLPDVALALGPFLLPDYRHAVRPSALVDVLLVLRGDNEVGPARGPQPPPGLNRRGRLALLSETVSRELGRLQRESGRARAYQFRLIDWEHMLNDDVALSDARQRKGPQLRGRDDPLGVHLQVRINNARRTLSTAAVVVTDRLHCGVLALLQFQFHVTLDNSYGKVGHTRDNAFNASAACADTRALRAASAQSLEEALAKAAQLVAVSERLGLREGNFFRGDG